ncbi:MAG: rhombotarget lipoprotein [Verrucomicrobiales bacterium]|nr:rhombotarget lipoprotein [Verrucomicrobiales bacterium]
MKYIAQLTAGLIMSLTLLTTGCSTFTDEFIFQNNRKQHQANNLFQYLYPNKGEHIDTPSIPVLSLPLRVGIAFVPDCAHSGNSQLAPLSESKKMELMKEVSKDFKAMPFVKSIELIPTTYLAPEGGFANLDQLRTMYDIDVITLISYDQVQFTDHSLWSVSYWTVVGLYVVQGERNETRTMLDAAVYDIASRKMLFRGPGISNIKASATPFNLERELRENSEKGFASASTNLVTAIHTQLDEFRDRVRSSPEEYKIVHKKGYTGGGSMGSAELSLLACAGLSFLCLRRNKTL